MEGINRGLQRMDLGNTTSTGAESQDASKRPTPPRPMGTGTNAIPLGGGQTKNGPARALNCLYCREETHSKMRCPKLTEHLDQGVVRIQEGSNFVILSSTGEVAPVRPYGEPNICAWVEKRINPPAQAAVQVNALALEREEMEDQEHAPSLRVPDFKPFVGYIEVDTLEHVETAEHNDADSEPSSSEEVEPTQDTRAYDALPLDAMSAKRARVEDVDDDEVQQTHPTKKRDLKREAPVHLETPWRRPAPSSEAKGKQVQRPQIRRPRDEDTANVPMTQAEEGNKKERLNKMQAPVAFDLRSVTDSTYKKMMHQDVTLSARDLIALAPSLQDMLKDDCSRRRVPADKVINAAASSSHSKAFDTNEAWYDVPLSKRAYAGALAFAKGLVNGKPAKMLIDSGAMISVMSEQMRKYFGLPIRLDGNHTVRGINGDFETLRGISENVTVSLGEVETSVHFFVHNKPNHDVVLGQAFLMRVAASVDYDIEGSVVLTMKGNKGKIVRMEVTPKTASYLINVDNPEDSAGEARVLTGSYNQIIEIDDDEQPLKGSGRT